MYYAYRAEPLNAALFIDESIVLSTTITKRPVDADKAKQTAFHATV